MPARSSNACSSQAGVEHRASQQHLVSAAKRNLKVSPFLQLKPPDILSNVLTNQDC